MKPYSIAKLKGYNKIPFSMILRNLPNAMTLMRLFLIMPFLYFLSQQKYVDAFYLFVVAGLTDALDGWLARCFRWQSAFGTLIDPIADKLLIASSFIALAIMGHMPWWLVVLVFLRDLAITLGVYAWYIVMEQRPILSPTYLSKINTVMQLILVIVCLYEQAFGVLSFSLYFILLVITTLTTTLSFLDYAWIWFKKVYLQIKLSK